MYQATNEEEALENFYHVNEKWGETVSLCVQELGKQLGATDFVF